MSRSYQHHSLRSRFREYYMNCVCYRSNKKSKRHCNRMFRRKCNHIRASSDCENMDDVNFPNTTKEVMNIYDFNSDGHRYHRFLKRYFPGERLTLESVYKIVTK